MSWGNIQYGLLLLAVFVVAGLLVVIVCIAIRYYWPMDSADAQNPDRSASRSADGRPRPFRARPPA